MIGGLLGNSGSFATLGAIRRLVFFVSSFAVDRRCLAKPYTNGEKEQTKESGTSK
jgi:hypothetical protein